MEAEQIRPTEEEVTITDIWNSDQSPSHGVRVMRHYLLRMMKKKNHEQYLADLPEPIQKRIMALKKLQIETMELEAAFHRKAFEMEKDYQKQHEHIFKKRLDIILGTYEPSDEDCHIPEPELSATALTVNEQMNKLKLAYSSDDISSGTTATAPVGDIKGIPDFWLTVLKYVPKVEVLVKEYDEPILKHLTDIKVGSESDPTMSFFLEFHFSSNEYFTNDVLKKEYMMKCNPDPNDPFSFDGPEIYDCSSTQINWKDGKDVTVEKAMVNGEEQITHRPSFFNFFAPPGLPTDSNDPMFMTVNAILEADFEVGHYLKDRVVPRAVLYYTGEAKDDPEYESEMCDSNLEMLFENPDDDKFSTVSQEDAEK